MENSMDEPVPYVYHQEKMGVIYKPPDAAFYGPSKRSRRESSLKSRATARVARQFGPDSSTATTEGVEVKSKERVDSTKAVKQKRRAKGQDSVGMEKPAARPVVRAGNPSAVLIDLTASSSDEDGQRGQTRGRAPAKTTPAVAKTARGSTKRSKSEPSKRSSFQ